MNGSRNSYDRMVMFMYHQRLPRRSLAVYLALLLSACTPPQPTDAFPVGRPASEPATVSDLSDVLGMTVKQTQKLIQSTPSKNFERKYIVENARQILSFLTKERKIMPKDKAKKLIQKSPSILTYTRTNIEETTEFFLSECSLSEAEYTKMLLTYPQCLGMSIDNRLRPVIDFFRGDIGAYKWKWIVVRYPQIFRNANVLRPGAQFMYEKLNIEQWADLGQIASKYPPVFWLSEQTIAPKLDFLQQALKLSTDELRDILVTYPQLLGLSLDDNLRPTVEFLLSNNGADLTVPQLSYFVSYQPAILAYSLEKRIKPRMERMREANIRLEYSTPVIMSYTDKKFDRWLEQHTASWSIS